MNKSRRKEIAKAVALMEEAISILAQAREGEEYAYDNFPESLQNSEKGEVMQEWIDRLETAEETIQEQIDELMYDL